MKLFGSVTPAKPSVMVDSLYDIKEAIQPDEYLAKLRELKVAKLKKDMGSKYLLAVPFKRSTNLEK